MTDLRLSDNQGMATDVRGDGSPLLVTFGGVAIQPGAPMFEFFKITADGLPGQRVFLRDHGRGWYHHGVWGVADSIPGVHAWLHDRIQESQAATRHSCSAACSTISSTRSTRSRHSRS
jgi:hypothetical protein